jgi:NAD(P)-dependent dehydrogenase (short-subunit alcohol dehydrogenase family)
MDQLTKNQIIFITGATSGIGKITACWLAQRGATVVATERNEEKGKQLIHDFKRDFPNSKGTLETLHCDLSCFMSVVDAVKIFKKKYKRIDLLINNAGIFNAKHKISNDGIEETFQVNILSPLLLTLLFEQMIIDSKGRVINTSSSFHHGTINFNDIEGRRFYSGLNAYRQSKLAEILICKIIDARIKKFGALIFCQHPGIVRTNLGNSKCSLFNMGLKLIGKSAEKGAETLIYLATSPADKLISGEYYAFKKIWKTKPQSNNLVLAEKLFKVALSYIEPYFNKYLFFN